MFITLEGIEGVGKSSAMAFMAQFLEKAGIALCLTREPGGTILGDELRKIFLAHRTEPMQPMAELLLMFGARAQHVETLIKPALAQGKWVLCDRFVDTSYAYQGAGRGLPESQIATLQHLVLGDFKPDYTLIFDAPLDIALARMKGRGTKDRIESETQAFFERAQHYYKDLVSKDPKRTILVDASKSLIEVQKILVKQLTLWIQQSREQIC